MYRNYVAINALNRRVTWEQGNNLNSERLQQNFEEENTYNGQGIEDLEDIDMIDGNNGHNNSNTDHHPNSNHNTLDETEMKDDPEDVAEQVKAAAKKKIVLWENTKGTREKEINIRIKDILEEY